MKTNLKTDLYGFLCNNRVYDLDVNDAKGFIKKGLAEQVDIELILEGNNNIDLETKPVCSKEELKLRGVQEKKKKLKTKMILKKNMIKANSKNKMDAEDQCEIALAPLKEELEFLAEKEEQMKEKLNGKPEKNTEEIEDIMGEAVEEIVEESKKENKNTKKKNKKNKR